MGAVGLFCETDHHSSSSPLHHTHPYTNKRRYIDWRRLLRRLARKGGQGGGADYDSEDEEEEEGGGLPKGPPSIVSSLQTSIHSLQTGVRSYILHVEDHFHRMCAYAYICIHTYIVCVCMRGICMCICV